MSDLPPDPSGRQGRPLPDILPARAKLPTSLPPSQAFSPTSAAGSSSSTSNSTGSNLQPRRPSASILGARPGSASLVPLPPRTQLTRVACEACRRRRTKCTGDRPRCAACVKNRSECTYSSVSSAETNSQALKRRLEETEDEMSVFNQLYDALATKPEPQAQEILRRIRMGADAASVVKLIKDGDLLLQVHLVPETRLRYNFPYRAAMPTAIQRSNSAYLGSVMLEAIFAEDQAQKEDGGNDQRQRRQDDPQGLVTRHPPQYMRPYHAAKLIDPRLGMVDVTMWTQVITNNHLFVELLSAYFMQEYPVFPVFHKDTFLQALVDGDKRFCSPLLVNVLMAEACHCHLGIPNRPRYWDPLNLGYRFLAEAKRLWELRRAPCTLVEAQAAALLNLVYAHNGLDQIGRTYLLEAVSMGHALGIFSSAVEVQDADMSDARLFTAWAIFRWTTVNGFYHKRPGIMNAPPDTPLPSPDERPGLYGDLHLQYPLDEALQQTEFGHLFRAASALRAIMNVIAFSAFTVEEPNALSAERWLAFRNQLESWLLASPVCLLPKNIVWPSQFVVHMEYHSVLITLCRVRITEDAVGGLPASTSLVASARRAAQEAMPQAIIQLETIIRLYYLRHSFEYCDSFLSHFLSAMCNIAMGSRVIDSVDEDALEHTRSTLVLCLKGLADQARHTHISAVICRLMIDRQTQEDLNLLGGYIAVDILEDRSVLEQKVASAYPLENGGDTEAARLENLLRKHNPGLQLR